MTKVLVFGVFDGLHDGHRSFLRQAKACGDCLVIAVAQDAVVHRLKNKKPHFTLTSRILALQKSRVADEVVAGDIDIGTWGVLEKYKPDVIAIGYDQKALQKGIEAHIKNNHLKIKLVVLDPHKPEIYKSSRVR